MIDYKAQYQNYLHLIEDYLCSSIEEIESDGNKKMLKEAMKYSLLSGGKRIRPVLTLAVADVFGVPLKKALPFACAVEMIHASSLIHDDLPALDNDDLRRGKPSNHKVFGEAMAVICGDALMNYAYETMLSNISDQNELNAARFVAFCTGYGGMLGGQAIDIVGTDSPNETYLYKLDRHKTSKLILAAVMCGELLSGSVENKLYEFGDKLGLLFQFTDDILDVVGSREELGKTIGKDKEENKITAVSVFGLDGAKEKAEKLKTECLIILSGIENTEFLKCLALNVAERRR